MRQDKLRVGVVGTGRWAVRSHIPGRQRDPRCEVVALADTDADAPATDLHKVIVAASGHPLEDS